MVEITPLNTNKLVPSTIGSVNAKFYGPRGETDKLDLVWQDMRPHPTTADEVTIAGLFVAMDALHEYQKMGVRYPTIMAAFVFFDLELFPLEHEFWDFRNNYFRRVMTNDGRSFADYYYVRPRAEASLRLANGIKFPASVLELTAINGINIAQAASTITAVP